MKHKSNTIYQVEKIPFDINLLKKYLGETNYSDVEIKPSRVVVKINELGQVNLEEIKKLKAVTGVVASSKSVSIILGEFSKAVANGLKHD
ncbi:hypothetical protein [Mycoplasma buteonis]|uniref:hypothetical protein n=1 Tax=Mycoplasma buteonis TaxID=171280 RepID=UPI000A03CAF2|nr:hypothetical protein [Mycoplasma buteonis]